MEQYAYIRVSTKEQNIDRQKMALEPYHIREENIYCDYQSGKDFERLAYTRKPMGKIGATDVTNAAFGAVLGGVLGGGVGSALGGHLGKKAFGEDGLKNAKVIEAHEGETFSCDVKADLRGMPKITWM